MSTNPKPIRILRLPAVMERTGLSKDSVYRLAKAGSFPQPIKLGIRASGWRENEVDAALEARTAERDARHS